jgi:hypothetical protein
MGIGESGNDDDWIKFKADVGYSVTLENQHPDRCIRWACLEALEVNSNTPRSVGEINTPAIQISI